MEDQEDGGRRWALEPRFSRRWGLARGAAVAAVWAPVEAVLAWLTAASVTTPFGVTLGIGGLPEGWPAVPVVTGLLAVTGISTLVGIVLPVWAAEGGRTDIVAVDDRGVRTERQGTGGPRTVVDLDWNQLRGGEFLGRTVADDWVANRLSRAGTPQQHRQIAEHLTARLAVRPTDAAPMMRGWTAWYDDRGATLEENRRDRGSRAWLCGSGAVVTGAHTAAFYAATQSDPRWWFLVLGCGWATVSLTVRCGENVLRPPRWIARPGKVVLGRGQGLMKRSISWS